MTARTIVLTAFLFAASIGAAAQEAQQVPRLTDERMSAEWYSRQASLWESKVKADPANANAWFNYFRATRYAGFAAADSKAADAKLDTILAGMEKAVPNTFEYNLARWTAGGNNDELFPYLKKALALRQDYAELASSLISYYELHGERDKVAEYSREWYRTRAMAPSLLAYSYNVLQSLEPNAVIVTCGDNDTYPLWILQYALGIRTDVAVLNVSLVSQPEYRAWFMRRENLGGDASLLDWDRFATVPYTRCAAEFLRSVAADTKDRPFYVGLTCDTSYLTLLRDDLYTVGLASRFSPKRFDNIAVIRRNWARFDLDYLRFDIYGDAYAFNRSWLPQLNMNYIVPTILLFEHEYVAGNYQNASELRELMVNIARVGGRERDVNEYIRNVTGDSPKTTSNGDDRRTEPEKVVPEKIAPSSPTEIR